MRSICLMLFAIAALPTVVSAQVKPVDIPFETADGLELQGTFYPSKNGGGSASVIIMHSVFWQYMPAHAQVRTEAAILKAGELATADRPFGWLSFEPDPPAISPMQLRLRLWPSGGSLHLAACHPHGASINWFGREKSA